MSAVWKHNRDFRQKFSLIKTKRDTIKNSYVED